MSAENHLRCQKPPIKGKLTLKPTLRHNQLAVQQQKVTSLSSLIQKMSVSSHVNNHVQHKKCLPGSYEPFLSVSDVTTNSLVLVQPHLIKGFCLGAVAYSEVQN